MFLKLLKKEMKSSIKTYLIICLIPILLSIILGILMFFDLYDIFFSVLPIWIISLLVCSVALFIFTYQSINKRLFDDGGYLTLTMPVKTSHIVLTKFLCALILSFICLITTYLSIFIVVMMIPDITDIINAIYSILQEENILSEIGSIDILLFILANFISLIYSIAITMAISTYVHKNKLTPKGLLFVVLYIAYMVITTTIFSFIPDIINMSVIQLILIVIYVYFTYNAIEKDLDI